MNEHNYMKWLEFYTNALIFRPLNNPSNQYSEPITGDHPEEIEEYLEFFDSDVKAVYTQNDLCCLWFLASSWLLDDLVQDAIEPSSAETLLRSDWKSNPFLILLTANGVYNIHECLYWFMRLQCLMDSLYFPSSDADMVLADMFNAPGINLELVCHVGIICMDILNQLVTVRYGKDGANGSKSSLDSLAGSVFSGGCGDLFVLALICVGHLPRRSCATELKVDPVMRESATARLSTLLKSTQIDLRSRSGKGWAGVVIEWSAKCLKNWNGGKHGSNIEFAADAPSPEEMIPTLAFMTALWKDTVDEQGSGAADLVKAFFYLNQVARLSSPPLVGASSSKIPEYLIAEEYFDLIDELEEDLTRLSTKPSDWVRRITVVKQVRMMLDFSGGVLLKPFPWPIFRRTETILAKLLESLTGFLTIELETTSVYINDFRIGYRKELLELLNLVLLSVVAKRKELLMINSAKDDKNSCQIILARNESSMEAIMGLVARLFTLEISTREASPTRPTNPPKTTDHDDYCNGESAPFAQSCLKVLESLALVTKEFNLQTIRVPFEDIVEQIFTACTTNDTFGLPVFLADVSKDLTRVGLALRREAARAEIEKMTGDYYVEEYRKISVVPPDASKKLFRALLLVSTPYQSANIVCRAFANAPNVKLRKSMFQILLEHVKSLLDGVRSDLIRTWEFYVERSAIDSSVELKGMRRITEVTEIVDAFRLGMEIGTLSVDLNVVISAYEVVLGVGGLQCFLSALLEHHPSLLRPAYSCRLATLCLKTTHVFGETLLAESMTLKDLTETELKAICSLGLACEWLEKLGSVYPLSAGSSDSTVATTPQANTPPCVSPRGSPEASCLAESGSEDESFSSDHSDQSLADFFDYKSVKDSYAVTQNRSSLEDCKVNENVLSYVKFCFWDDRRRPLR